MHLQTPLDALSVEYVSATQRLHFIFVKKVGGSTHTPPEPLPPSRLAPRCPRAPQDCYGVMGLEHKWQRIRSHKKIQVRVHACMHALIMSYQNVKKYSQLRALMFTLTNLSFILAHPPFQKWRDVYVLRGGDIPRRWRRAAS